MENLFYYPAQVIRAISPNLAQLFPTDEALLARYRERYPDSPAEEPFFLRLEISNNSLDWYFTHQLTTSLRNYATQADTGVGLQDSHSIMRLGYGRSLFGLYNSEPGTPPGWDRAARRGGGAMLAIPRPEQYERTLCADYIIPGIKLNNLTFASTDDFIRGIEAGMVEEISIGFSPGSMHCDICGADYFSFECRHIAGFAYDVERNNQQLKLLATVAVGDAQLMEHSVVYAGATPNAAVVRKAEQEAEAGRLTRKQAAVIEERYRVRLPMSPQNWPGAEDGNRDKSQERKPDMDELEQARALLAEINATGETVIDQVRWLIDENSRLVTLADDGRAYRTALTDAALAEGVRAQGDKFPQETYRTMFATAPLDHIRQLLESWGGQASQVFTGGRKTEDAHTPPAARPARRTVPREAYRA